MHNFEQALSSNIVFSKFNKIDLSKLCQYVDKKSFKEGETIFAINDNVNSYYLIDTGVVNIINESGDIKTITNNSSFGDESIIGLNVAFCTAVAQEDCEILVIDKEFIININDFTLNKQYASNNLLCNIGKHSRVVEEKAIVKKDNPYLLNLLAWATTIILPIFIVYLLFGIEYPPNRSQILLIYIFLSSVFMWSFKLVPEFVPALYLLFGMVLLSLAPTSVILSGFYSNAFFLAIALSALGAIISISGLSYRILLYLFKFGGNNKVWRHIALFLSGAIITPVIPSANGRANILYPLFTETLSLYKLKKGTVEYQRLLASTIGGISLLSPIFLTSKSINLLALGMLSIQDQYNFQFYHWFISASVVGLVLLIFYAFFNWLIFRNEQQNYINTDFLKIQISILGKTSTEEIFAIISVLIFVVIVLTGSLHNLQTSWLAMLLVVFLFILGVLKRRNFNKSIDWDFLVFLSALLGFANTMSYLDMHTWMSNYTGWIADIINTSFIEFVSILAAITFVLRIFLPINIAVILLAGILVPVTTNTGVSPWLAIFIILLFSENYTYNFSASYVMQFLYSVKDNAFYWRILLLQIVIYIVKFMAVIISIPFWQYLGILVEL